MNALFGTIAEVGRDTVTLTDGLAAHFAPRFTPLLEQLRTSGMPVYLELDESRAIARVYIPDIVRIETLTDDSVTFTESHARHTIDRSVANRLREYENRQVAVTTNDAGEIIDIRPCESAQHPPPR